MSDLNYGSIPLPVQVTPSSKEDPVLDPTLDLLGAYLKGALNRQLGPAWKRIENPKLSFVQSVHTHDPQWGKGLALNRNDLPALYVWREKVEREWWYTVDWRMRASQLHVLWLPWTDPQQERKKVVHALFGPFTAAVDAAVELGRDLGYVVRGDADTKAVTEGSLIYVAPPGIFRLQTGGCQRATVEVRDVEGNPGVPLQYDAFLVTLELWERLDLDLAARYALLAGVDVEEELLQSAEDTNPLPYINAGEDFTWSSNFDPDDV